MDDHGYDQAACRRAAELLREEAVRIAAQQRDAYSAVRFVPYMLNYAAEWLEGYRA